MRHKISARVNGTRYLSSVACGAALLFAIPMGVTYASPQTDTIRPHVYKSGEVLRYHYDDSDTTYCGALKDGVVLAAIPLQVTQLDLQVRLEVRQTKSGLEHVMTVLDQTGYRKVNPGSAATVPFQPIAKLVASFPKPFSYAYKDESSALANLFSLFKGVFSGVRFMANPVSKFLFFKVQDVHQMLASADKIHSGFAPQEMYVVHGKAQSGLGGSFTSGDALYEYVGVREKEGHRFALIRVNDLGNQFSTGSMQVITNFTYQMLIALNGPQAGLLIDGNGQETAYPKSATPSVECPHPVLQRQFSISLKP